jgi:hypothetical protein
MTYCSYFAVLEMITIPMQIWINYFPLGPYRTQNTLLSTLLKYKQIFILSKYKKPNVIFIINFKLCRLFGKFKLRSAEKTCRIRLNG